jgi:TIGR03009 family protein
VPADEAKYIDDVLKYWESSTSKIKTYKCDFQKFSYNPNFAPLGTVYEDSTGVIMYAQPDKGLYRVDTIHRYRPPKEKGGKAEWPLAEGEKGEHWICDGKAVFYFDYLNKILRKTKLPPVMQGKAIADGPLPFVFGAEAKKIKERYWLHVTTPANVENEIHLAAVPKTRDDAANYKEIKIIIDHESFLPKAMIVFMPNYDAKLHPAKDTYVFKKRENNLSDTIWLPLAKQFYQPSTPDGWKLEEQEVPREEALPKVAAPKANAPAVTQKRPATANK